MADIDNINASSDTSVLDDFGLSAVYWSDKNGESQRIVCEGLKVTKKLKAEARKDSAQLQGYGWNISDLEYEFEFDAPYDYHLFDERYEQQVYDKHGLTISTYAQDENGKWVKKESLKSCIITDMDREFGNGIERSVKGVALAIESY